jgi:hypothetical protein
VGKGGQGVVVIGPEHQTVMRDCGWTQVQIREFLTRESRVSPEELADAGIAVEEEGNQHYLPISNDGKYPTYENEK